ARSRRSSRTLAGASSCPIDFWMRSRNSWSSSSFSRSCSTSTDSSRNSATFMPSLPRSYWPASTDALLLTTAPRPRLCWARQRSAQLCSANDAPLRRRLLPEAGRELRLDRQLRRGQVHRLARFGLGDAFHFEHDATGPDDTDPLLGCAFALAHSRFLWLLRDRLVGEHAHPDLSAALYEAGHRDARRFDLPVGDRGRLHRLEPVVAERHVGAAPGFAGHPPALLLAVLNFLGHQHWSNPRRIMLVPPAFSAPDPDTLHPGPSAE